LHNPACPTPSQVSKEDRGEEIQVPHLVPCRALLHLADDLDVGGKAADEGPGVLQQQTTISLGNINMKFIFLAGS
jgi:hypothetical protein